MDEFSWADEKIAELVGNGFFEVALDEQGEPMFRMTAEASEIDPEAFEVISQAAESHVSEALTELIEQGLVEVVGINTDGEFLYGLTEDGRAVVRSMGL